METGLLTQERSKPMLPTERRTRNYTVISVVSAACAVGFGCLVLFYEPRSQRLIEPLDFDGSPGDVEDGRAVIYGDGGTISADSLRLGGSPITASADDINQLTGQDIEEALHTLKAFNADDLAQLHGAAAASADKDTVPIYGAGGSLRVGSIVVDKTDVVLSPSDMAKLVPSISSQPIEDNKVVLYDDSLAIPVGLGGLSVTLGVGEEETPVDATDLVLLNVGRDSSSDKNPKSHTPGKVALHDTDGGLHAVGITLYSDSSESPAATALLTADMVALLDETADGADRVALEKVYDGTRRLRVPEKGIMLETGNSDPGVLIDKTNLTKINGRFVEYSGAIDDKRVILVPGMLTTSSLAVVDTFGVDGSIIIGGTPLVASADNLNALAGRTGTLVLPHELGQWTPHETCSQTLIGLEEMVIYELFGEPRPTLTKGDFQSYCKITIDGEEGTTVYDNYFVNLPSSFENDDALVGRTLHIAVYETGDAKGARIELRGAGKTVDGGDDAYNPIPNGACVEGSSQSTVHVDIGSMVSCILKKCAGGQEGTTPSDMRWECDPQVAGDGAKDVIADPNGLITVVSASMQEILLVDGALGTGNTGGNPQSVDATGWRPSYIYINHDTLNIEGENFLPIRPRTVVQVDPTIPSCATGNCEFVATLPTGVGNQDWLEIGFATTLVVARKSLVEPEDCEPEGCERHNQAIRLKAHNSNSNEENVLSMELLAQAVPYQVTCLYNGVSNNKDKWSFSTDLPTATISVSKTTEFGDDDPWLSPLVPAYFIHTTDVTCTPGAGKECRYRVRLRNDPYLSRQTNARITLLKEPGPAGSSDVYFIRIYLGSGSDHVTFKSASSSMLCIFAGTEGNLKWSCDD